MEGCFQGVTLGPSSVLVCPLRKLASDTRAESLKELHSLACPPTLVCVAERPQPEDNCPGRLPTEPKDCGNYADELPLTHPSQTRYVMRFLWEG